MTSAGHYKTEAIQEVFYGKSVQDTLEEIISSHGRTKRIAFVTNTSLTKKGGLADQVKNALGENFKEILTYEKVSELFRKILL